MLSQRKDKRSMNALLSVQPKHGCCVSDGGVQRGSDTADQACTPFASQNCKNHLKLMFLIWHGYLKKIFAVNQISTICLTEVMYLRHLSYVILW